MTLFPPACVIFHPILRIRRPFSLTILALYSYARFLWCGTRTLVFEFLPSNYHFSLVSHPAGILLSTGITSPPRSPQFLGILPAPWAPDLPTRVRSSTRPPAHGRWRTERNQFIRQLFHLIALIINQYPPRPSFVLPFSGQSHQRTFDSRGLLGCVDCCRK